MKTIQVGKLKSEFSLILDKVKNEGETYIIEYGKKHKKIAMLVPYEQKIKKRKFGQLMNQINIPEDFNEEISEINSMFYGNQD